MNQLLEVRGLVKRFPGGEGVSGVDLHIKKGEIIGFLGANGAGKTTTLRCIAGFYRPEEGEILVGGHKPGSSTAQYITAFIPDNPALYPVLTVAEHLQFRAKAFGAKGKVMKDKVQNALREVKLEEYADRPTGNLSRGQKQRVILAGAIIQEAEVYLFDEPTVGLDIPSKQWLAEWIRQLAAVGKGVMISSHSLDFVSETAQRVLLLHKGRLIGEKEVPSVETARSGWNEEVISILRRGAPQ